MRAWLILVIIVLFILWALWVTRPPFRVVYFDTQQAARGSYSQSLAPALTQRIDWFEVYRNPGETIPAGRYFAERYDVEFPATTQLLQSGTGTFYFPEGNIIFALTILRPEQDADPSTIDPGHIYTYPLLTGTGQYTGIQGTVTFDATTNHRRVIFNRS